MSKEDIFDIIIDEITKEEKQDELKKQEIIKNGCPCTNKIERIGTFTKIHFLECEVCHKQFDMDGNPIK